MAIDDPSQVLQQCRDIVKQKEQATVPGQMQAFNWAAILALIEKVAPLVIQLIGGLVPAGGAVPAAHKDKVAEGIVKCCEDMHAAGVTVVP